MKLVYSCLSFRAYAPASGAGSALAEQVAEIVGPQVQHDSISHGALGYAPWGERSQRRIEGQP